MSYQLSPGENVTELDLTTIVPSVSSTAGAFVAYTQWGPAQKITTITDEIALVNTFAPSGPDANSAVNFLTAASFLAYGNNLQFVRAVGANSFNATANTSATSFQSDNKDVFQSTGYLTTGAGNSLGAFVARYPGAIGNSLQIDTFDSSNTAAFNSATFTSGGVTRNWSSVVNAAPTTSAYAQAAGGSNDEFHIVVTDAGGLFTGTKGTVLEIFAWVSKASDAQINNNSNYWKQVIFDQSKYVLAVDAVDYLNTSTTWGKLAAGTTFNRTASATVTTTLGRGTDDVGTDASLINGWSLFANKEAVDISLVLTGDADVTVQQYVIDNIVTQRADCVGFVTPPQSAVVNQPGQEAANITTWLGSLSRSSTYVVADSGWKYMYDKYNQSYRWIPLNGDIAGLCVHTDTVNDPWYSPAGFNRGAIKNVVKLAWNPSKTFRDILYSQGVNPVVSFPGQGTVLFGDKTLTVKPSAFDRINVRRLFIVLEKMIAKAAQYSLFEFNDTFTQAQFVALVTPFLRDVQGRRGVTNFKVVCDSTNNTAAVINANQFVGDIYIQPARSTNFIQLNFVAVGTGVDFNTIVGAAQ
jgi:phage tail sheath protein FI